MTVSYLMPTTSRGTVRWRVTFTGADIGRDLTIQVTAPGVSYVVRGWAGVTSPGIAVIIDHEAPLNVQLRYAVVLDGVERASASGLVVPSDSPLITDPVRGRHVPVTIKDWPEAVHMRAGQVLEISGSPVPIIIDSFERSATSSVELLHNIDAASAADLEDLLADGSAIRIRPSCPYLPAEWVSARSRARRRFSRRADSAAVDSIELVHTGMPAPDERAIGNTLGDLHEMVPGTLANIRTRWPGTLADIAAEDLLA